jgi:hypothetical protein
VLAVELASGLMRAKDFDTCECGDYLKDHSEGWRECNTCSENDPMNGRKCLMFRPFTECVIYQNPVDQRRR